VGRLSEHLVGEGIDGDDLVPVVLEISGNVVGGLSRRGRTADDGDGVECEDLAELVLGVDWHGPLSTGEAKRVLSPLGASVD